MPWVAPVRVATGGDTVDGVQFTRDFTISCNAGDLVTWTVLTSNYPLDVQSISGGGISWAQGTIRSLGSGYGNAYTYYGISPTTQTFNVRFQMQNTINSTIYNSLFRWYVWRNHGGVGYTGAYRGSGEPWLNVNQTVDKSSFIHASVDWNANAANGVWLNEAGTAADGVLVRSGAAIYWCNSGLDSTGIGTKRLGVTSTSSTRLTGVGLEIKGIYVDTQAPSTVSGITATVLGPDSIRIDWAASTDDVGVTKYRVYDNGVQLGPDIDVSVRTYTHTGLAAASTHSYTVRALDAVGNISAVPTAVSATTTYPYLDKAMWMSTRPKLYLGSTVVNSLFVGDTKIWP